MLSRRFYKLLAIFLIVGCVIYIPIFALDRLIVNKPNHPVSLAIKDRFKQLEQWRPFTSQKGKFRVLIPGGYPKVSDQVMAVEGRPIKLRSFQVNRRNPISYTISYFDFATAPANPQTVVQAMSNESIKTMKARKLNSKDISLGQVRGREVYLQTMLQEKLPAVMRHRILLKRRRVYQLVVVTPMQDKFKEESDKFMDSFEIIN